MGLTGENRIKQTSLILLSGMFLASCAPGVPDMPEVYQCQYSGKPRAFYCMNTKTKEKIKLSADDPSMKAALCLSADDYKKSEAWVKSVIELAKTRCQ